VSVESSYFFNFLCNFILNLFLEREAIEIKRNIFIKIAYILSIPRSPKKIPSIILIINILIVETTSIFFSRLFGEKYPEKYNPKYITTRSQMRRKRITNAIRLGHQKPSETDCVNIIVKFITHNPSISIIPATIIRKFFMILL